MSSAVLSTSIIWQPDDYIFFKKCGEITISPDIQNFGFNCLFCNGICLQTDIFLQHLQEQHKEEVFQLYEQQIFSNELLKENNFNAEFALNLNEIDLNVSLNNFSLTTNILNGENQVTKENSKNCNKLYTNEVNLTSPSSDNLNLVFDFETNNLLALTSPNQDLENLIISNPLENVCDGTIIDDTNITATSSSTLLNLNTTSASRGSFKCLTDDNECEIGDGEDSGISLVQSPSCSNDYCGGFSYCMSFTEDTSSKSTPTYVENCSSPNLSPEYTATTTKTDANKVSSKSYAEKYLKTPAMRKALNNKELIEYLLEAFRRNEKLWNPQHPSYKYNSNRAIYNELSEPLLNDMKYSLTGVEIFGIINELRGRYRRELKKFEIRKGKHKTHLWYFEKMEFLRNVIEKKRKERHNEVREMESEKKLTNREVLSYLLKLYRQHSCLWNPAVEEYKTCQKVRIFQDIIDQLKEKHNIDMTVTEAMNELQKLCMRYRKELRMIHILKGLYFPKLWCFDEMEFLRPIMEEKINENLKKINKFTNSSLSRRKHEFLKAVEIKFDSLKQQIQFIEIYRNFNSLWDADHPDYRSINYRKKALSEMLKEINLLFSNSNFKLDQLEKTIYQLRKKFSQEKQKRLTEKHLQENSCGMSFVLYEKLSEFLSINLGPFRCNTCQKISKTYDQYKIHKSKHEGTLPFICTLCGKGFQIPGNLTIHIRRHRQDYPYSCEICQKSFATSTEVSIHLRSHTGERPYDCEWCDKTFKTWSFYDLHRRTHLKQSNFHCPICEKSFYERNRFTDHMNIHLNIRKHLCEECGKSFTTLGNLKKHLDLHAAIKKFKCHNCGKSFAQFAGLRWHQKSHHKP